MENTPNLSLEYSKLQKKYHELWNDFKDAMDCHDPESVGRCKKCNRINRFHRYCRKCKYPFCYDCVVNSWVSDIECSNRC